MFTHATRRILMPAFITLFATPAFAAITLAPASNLPTGSQPSGLAAGDFDGDGDVDLATTSDTGPDIIEIKLNDGSGGYTAGPSSFLPASSSAQDLIAGDLDGDGDVDLAVAVRDPAGAVLFMANGAGAFTNSGTTIVGDRPRGLSIGDVDGDGDLDLSLANRDDGTVSLLINNGLGAFAVSTMTVGAETRDTALGDFDADGDLDLAVSESDSRSVVVFSFDLMIGMMPSQTLSVGPVVRPDGVVAADLDGDGDIDLAAGTSDQTLGINQVATFRNTLGTFSGAVAFDTGGTNTSSITAADFNCDGLMDLATANTDSNDISTLENLGGGTFGAGQTSAAGTGPDDILAADLDGDGDADVAAANRGSNSISVYDNGTCITPICDGDTDGNGLVNIDDIVNVVLDFGSPGDGNGDGFNGDVNGSGLVDIDDIVVTVLAFGTCG